MSDHAPQRSPESQDFEDVLAQFLQLEEKGHRPDPQQLLESHPELADRLRAFFHDRDWFGREAPRLAPTPSPTTVPEDANDVAAGAPVLSAGNRFAGYEILSELGKGGMGIVYKARQLNPERLVALKVIRADRLEELSDRERRRWIDRFHREAQLVAALDRPAHIVNLYEVGEWDSQPYFTMRLVEGGSLAQRLREAEAEGPEKAAACRVQGQRGNARLLAQVARAVHYAHQRGVLHRDLKPANVLLDVDGQPLVTDFGLARRIDETGSVIVGGFEGTAEYVAPEQARAAPADVPNPVPSGALAYVAPEPVPGATTTAVDVYGLGAILYELLTGQPPFRGANAVETLIQVLTRKATPLRQIERRLNRDLASICMKCLEKEPAQRYPSAAAVADDLENWLAGRTINARQAGTLERAWRWCRRNPVPTVAAGVVLAIAVVAFILIADSRNNALALADEKGQLADANGKLAEEKGTLAREEHAQRLAVQAEAALRDLQDGANLCEQPGKAPSGLLAMTQALAGAARAENRGIEGAVRLNVAAWEQSRLPLRLFLRHGPDTHLQAAPVVAFSPDGLTVVTGGQSPSGPEEKGPVSGKTVVLIWNGRDGTPRCGPISFPKRITAAAVSLDGRKALVGDETGLAYLLDTSSGKKVSPPLRHPGMVRAALFTPDGKRVLVAAGPGQVWDVETGKAVGPPLAHAPAANGRPGDVMAIALSPDGATVLTGAIVGARLWEVLTGQPRGEPMLDDSEIVSVDFSPDGRLLVMGGGRHVYKGGLPSGAEGVVQVRETATGRKVLALPHPGYVRQARFSPDGTRIATAALDRTARLWSTATGQPVAPPLSHGDIVTELSFSPDGRVLATGGKEAGIRLWDARAGESLGLLLHPGLVEFLEFSPNGTNLRTAARGGTVFVWDATGPPAQVWARQVGGQPKGYAFRVGSSLYLTSSGEATCCAFSSDGKVLLAGHGSGAVLIEAATGLPAGQPLEKRDLVSGAGFSRDGSRVWLGGLGGTLGAWDTTTGRPVVGPLPGPGRLMHLALSPDDKTVAAGRDDRTGPGGAGLWGADTGRHVRDLPHPGRVRVVAFGPDSGTVLTAGEDGTVRLWDPATGKPRGAPLVHPHPVFAAAFSPDGKTVATGCGRQSPPVGEFHLWDATSNLPRGRPMSFRGPVMAVAFRADGGAVAAGSMDGVARTYRVDDGRPLGPDLPHPGSVLAVAFAPDGRLLLTGGVGGARLWDPGTGRQVGPLRRVGGKGDALRQ